MKRWVWLLVPVVTACTIDELSTAQVEQNAGDYQAGDYQSGDYQAGDYQSGDYQSGDYQGAHYDASTFAGATLNGGALSEAHVFGTMLVVWKKVKALTYPYYAWEERRPNKICKWNADRTSSVCTYVDPSVTASPLAGVRFPTTLRTATGTMSGWVQIGSTTSALNAVRHDTSYAAWPLTNIWNGALSYSSAPPINCTNPAGCRQNSDLWVYDVRLINADGTQIPFCSTGQSYALKGTWDSVGTFVSSETQFTFACTTGTIAKCTRWGYRTWVNNAVKADGTPNVALGPYHQACVRAAMADYCANGHSFTKSHTLVDLYDYDGFISNMQALYPDATAFLDESEFDPKGATQVDFVRYQELSQDDAYGSITSPAPIGCPGTFNLPVAPADPRDPIYKPYQRDYSTMTYPRIGVRSTPVCSHTEGTIGKYLHPKCSGCTRTLTWDSNGVERYWSYCTSPLDSRGWNDACRQQANIECNWDPHAPHSGTSKMAAHGECEASSQPIPKYASACTAEVCRDPNFDFCCTTGWTDACVTHANEQCKGGREHWGNFQNYGFCNQVIQPQNSL